ncbi:MAG: type III pantothenate kinase [Elusimicrobia bacterium]|nr:type III pantothenate kinase [Elusimicrobiota bacterium]
MIHEVLLAIDVGNTNVTVGAFQGEKLLNLWRLGTDPKKTADEYGAALRAVVGLNGSGTSKVVGVVYGSVVPALNPAFEGAAKRYFGVDAVAVTPESPVGIALKVDQPGEVGADRILNALAAIELVGAPAIVIDFGTATTFDCISAKGEYLGGAILLGPKMQAAALARCTAKLPEVDVVKPKKIIGTTTVGCIQAGLYHGYLGMLERVLEGSLEEMKPAARGKKIHVIATGGLAPLFMHDLKGVHRHMPDLTLQGLRLAFATLAGRNLVRPGRTHGRTAGVQKQTRNRAEVHKA